MSYPIFTIRDLLAKAREYGTGPKKLREMKRDFYLISLDATPSLDSKINLQDYFNLIFSRYAQKIQEDFEKMGQVSIRIK